MVFFFFLFEGELEGGLYPLLSVPCQGTGTSASISDFLFLRRCILLLGIDVPAPDTMKRGVEVKRSRYNPLSDYIPLQEIIFSWLGNYRWRRVLSPGLGYDTHRLHSLSKLTTSSVEFQIPHIAILQNFAIDSPPVVVWDCLIAAAPSDLTK